MSHDTIISLPLRRPMNSIDDVFNFAEELFEITGAELKEIGLNYLVDQDGFPMEVPVNELVKAIDKYVPLVKLQIAREYAAPFLNAPNDNVNLGYAYNFLVKHM